MQIPLDYDYITAQTQALVRINSINPDLEAGAKGEGDIGDYVADALTHLGVDPILQAVEPGRNNVIGVLHGHGEGPSLMLNAHLDTVGVTGMDAPFSGELRDGTIYGRGAYDMKASVAAMLGVMKALVASGVHLAGDVLFTAVVDEEYGSKGMDTLVQDYRADAAIVTEPTQLDICCAHRGFVWLEVITRGKAAHGSRFNEGIDANLHMGHVLVEIGRLGARLLQRDHHPLLQPPSIHAPLLNGGTSQAVYAAECRMELERRTLPGEDATTVTADIQTILDQLASEIAHFDASVRAFLQRSAYEIDPGAPIVQALAAASRQLLGGEPRIYGETWWMDSAILGDAGIDTVIVGPSGGGLHSAVEWVEVASVHRLAELLLRTATSFCGTR